VLLIAQTIFLSALLRCFSCRKRIEHVPHLYYITLDHLPPSLVRWHAWCRNPPPPPIKKEQRMSSMKTSNRRSTTFGQSLQVFLWKFNRFLETTTFSMQRCQSLKKSSWEKCLKRWWKVSQGQAKALQSSTCSLSSLFGAMLQVNAFCVITLLLPLHLFPF